jgi:ankyrin repeat protein
MSLLRNLVNESVGSEYGTALQIAADQCSLAMVKLLLDRGANPNIEGDHAVPGCPRSCSFRLVRDSRYGTALEAACFRGQLTIVKLLLQNNANPHIQGTFFGFSSCNEM